MKIARIELVHIRLPLVVPFRTSFGTATERDTFVLNVTTDAAEASALSRYTSATRDLYPGGGGQ